eukprot:356091_1
MNFSFSHCKANGKLEVSGRNRGIEAPAFSRGVITLAYDSEVLEAVISKKDSRSGVLTEVGRVDASVRLDVLLCMGRRKYCSIGVIASQTSRLEIRSWTFEEVDFQAQRMSDILAQPIEICCSMLNICDHDTQRAMNYIFDAGEENIKSEDKRRHLEEERQKARLLSDSTNISGQWEIAKFGSFELQVSPEQQDCFVVASPYCDAKGWLSGYAFESAEGKFTVLGYWREESPMRPVKIEFDDRFEKITGLWSNEENDGNFTGTRLHDLFPDSLNNSPPGRAGLINVGNSCYMNSFVQSLRLTEPVRRRVLEGIFPLPSPLSPGPIAT